MKISHTLHLQVMDCTFQDNSTNFQVIELRICSGNIAPRILWYQYIVDFVLGQGIFNETILFYGRYGNTTVVGESYSLPLAYLLVTGTIYTISVIFLVYKYVRWFNHHDIIVMILFSLFSLSLALLPLP